MRLSQFQPLKLEEKLQVIREKHPIRGNQGIKVDKSIIDQVRRILDNTEDKNIPPLAWNFSKTQILACLEIVAIDRDGETAEKAATILITRPQERAILRGFQKLVLLYSHQLLEKVIKIQLEAKGYDTLKKTKFEPLQIQKWFSAKSLGTGLFTEYRAIRRKEQLDDYLATLPITKKDGLYKWTWRHLLTDGGTQDIRRESNQRLYSEFTNKDNIKFLKGFCINYLNKLNKIEYWYEPILDLVEREYGLPRDSSDKTSYENPFWKVIKDSTKDELKKWLLKKRIEDFFGRDERSDFWKSYVEQGLIQNAKPILYKEGFMVDFGKFGVIEFKVIGNAAYVYPKDIFQRYWRDAARYYNPGDFKDRSRTIQTFGSEGRILHFDGWQSTARFRLQRLLRR